LPLQGTLVARRLSRRRDLAVGRPRTSRAPASHRNPSAGNALRLAAEFVIESAGSLARNMHLATCGKSIR